MFSNPYISTAFRFVVLAALQVLVLSRIGVSEDWGRYLQVLFYPLVILLLPINLPTVIVLIISFALGMCIDVPLGTLGIHTSALVLTGFARSLVLAILEPREGYQVDQSPTKAEFGFQWFISYAAILMGVHCFTFFAVETFTFVFIGEILLRALGSFSVSMILIFLYVIILDPEA
ncbi:MAG: hypothetical protein AB8F78_03965 [Saprospiraceae bacterium]